MARHAQVTFDDDDDDDDDNTDKDDDKAADNDDDEDGELLRDAPDLIKTLSLFYLHHQNITTFIIA